MKIKAVWVGLLRSVAEDIETHQLLRTEELKYSGYKRVQLPENMFVTYEKDTTQLVILPGVCDCFPPVENSVAPVLFVGAGLYRSETDEKPFFAKSVPQAGVVYENSEPIVIQLT